MQIIYILEIQHVLTKDLHSSDQIINDFCTPGLKTASRYKVRVISYSNTKIEVEGIINLSKTFSRIYQKIKRNLGISD